MQLQTLNTGTQSDYTGCIPGVKLRKAQGWYGSYWFLVQRELDLGVREEPTLYHSPVTGGEDGLVL